MTHRTTITDPRLGQTILAFLFALMMPASALPEEDDPPPAPPANPFAIAHAKGLTLDQAIERLERENLTLAAMRLEIPQARADILTAGRRPDAFRLVSGADGPIRIESLDLVPKRWARILAARLASRVIEARYKDAVRTQAASLCARYVDVQEAEGQLQFAHIALKGFDVLVEMENRRVNMDQNDRTGLFQVNFERSRASVAVADAEVAFHRARLTLANLLEVPDSEAGRLEVTEDRGEGEPPPPPLAELTRLALVHRPDLRACRLGLWRARAEWLRAWLEQWPDLYVLSRPNRPGHPAAGGGVLPRPGSLFVILPDPDNSRGRLARAGLNVAQTRIELARTERQVISDVRQAHLESENSLAVLRKLKDEVLPTAQRVRDNAFRLYRGGEAAILFYLPASSEYNDAVHQYVKAAIRYRRGALALNSAVGKRVWPGTRATDD